MTVNFWGIKNLKSTKNGPSKKKNENIREANNTKNSCKYVYNLIPYC